MKTLTVKSLTIAAAAIAVGSPAIAGNYTFSDSFTPNASSNWSNTTGNWTTSGGTYYAQQPNNDPPAFTQLPFQFTNNGVTVTTNVNALADAGIVFGDPGTNNLVLILGG